MSSLAIGPAVHMFLLALETILLDFYCYYFFWSGTGFPMRTRCCGGYWVSNGNGTFSIWLAHGNRYLRYIKLIRTISGAHVPVNVHVELEIFYSKRRARGRLVTESMNIPFDGLY